ncbi:MAG: FAD-dependent oxidoreductase [Acidimicrobiia bacterium]
MSDSTLDILVAGAGAAGMAAALAASEQGLEVVVVEARETFRLGSNTAMSTSMVPAGGSRWQRRAGIEDSPELFYADIMTKTKAAADPVVARALTRLAPDLVAWMADSAGVPFELVTDFQYPGHSRDRCLAVADRAGSTLHRHLLDEAARRPEITLITPMRLTTLEHDGSQIVSARLETPDGGSEEVTPRSVVLATNGFGARQDLVARYIPEIEDALYHGGDGSTGDALAIGESLNADLGYLDAYQGHGSVASPHGILVTWATVMHGAVLVNVAGERFGDETTGYSEYAVPVLRQPEGVAWVVFDERIDRACRVFRDYQDLLEADAIRWSEGPEELAGVVGAPPATLGATLIAAGAAAVEESIDSFGRTRWEEPLRPPYGSIKVTGALFHTQGGLRVDHHARVLRNGAPIPGLYAAGGAAVGISGHGAAGYLAGNGLLSALGLGFLAGRDCGDGD